MQESRDPNECSLVNLPNIIKRIFQKTKQNTSKMKNLGKIICSCNSYTQEAEEG